MACGCASRKAAANIGVASKHTPAIAQNIAVHPVLPGESCIFCAYKHVATALTGLLSGAGISLVIGDLELGRRHTLLEYPSIAREIAATEYMASTRKLEPLPHALQTLQEHIGMIAGETSPEQKAADGLEATLESAGAFATNPLIGELHACAAYRLAFEIGYMLKNRYMIVGDLTLAAEHITKLAPEAAAEMRDIRHGIETARASDISRRWPALCDKISTLIKGNLSEYVSLYAKGLAAYLGVASTQTGETR